jgi:hypothetical protein
LTAFVGRVKRYEGIETQPWLLEIKSFTQLEVLLPEAMLFQTLVVRMNAKAVFGPDVDEGANFGNALIPFFEESDAELSELI